MLKQAKNTTQKATQKKPEKKKEKQRLANCLLMSHGVNESWSDRTVEPLCHGVIEPFLH